RPGQRALAEVLGRGVADAAAVDDPQAHAAARRDRRLARLAVLGVDLQAALDAAQHLQVDAAAPRLRQQPALRLLERHASPPTTISLTSRWGRPISVRPSPALEPHLPGSLDPASDTATSSAIVRFPLPSIIAPPTLSANPP